MSEAVDKMAAALQQGVNVFEEIGKLYCQVETQKKAIALAVQALQEILPNEVPAEPDKVAEVVDGETAGGETIPLGPEA